jgi:DNA-binding protein HU-beta
MNKGELIDAVAAAADLSKADAAAAVDAVVATVTDTLKKGKAPGFKAGKALKDAVN